MIDFSKIDMKVSRTELKKSHARLQLLAIPLASMAKKHWEHLPVTEFFLDELAELARITSPTAKNRQIKRVGKMMVEEDRHALVDAIFEIKMDTAQSAKALTWLTRLNIHDESTIKQFVRTFNASEYNSVHQLLLWIEYAKHLGDEALLAESRRDLESYLKEVALLSA